MAFNIQKVGTVAEIAAAISALPGAGALEQSFGSLVGFITQIWLSPVGTVIPTPAAGVRSPLVLAGPLSLSLVGNVTPTSTTLKIVLQVVKVDQFGNVIKDDQGSPSTTTVPAS